jgi:hypothetical protein
MAKETQQELPGISDPDNYRKLMEPVTVDDAEKNIAAFSEEFYLLRNKHHITDVLVTVKIPVRYKEGEVGEVMTSLSCGNELCREPMAAWAFGYEQSARQEMIAKIVKEHKSIKRPPR